MCNEYNGYPNYQTWRIASEIMDDEVCYHEIWKKAEELLRNNDPYREGKLGEYLKFEFENGYINLDEYFSSVYVDLLDLSLKMVDWTHLASVILDLEEDHMNHKVKSQTRFDRLMAGAK